MDFLNRYFLGSSSGKELVMLSGTTAVSREDFETDARVATFKVLRSVSVSEGNAWDQAPRYPGVDADQPLG